MTINLDKLVLSAPIIVLISRIVETGRDPPEISELVFRRSKRSFLRERASNLLPRREDRLYYVVLDISST